MITSEIKKLLEENIDLDYQKFNQRILPGVANILGVRMPIIKKIARQYYKNENIHLYIEQLDSLVYEEMLIKGLLIAQGQLDDRFKYVEAYAKEINNWAQCDLFCSSLKNLDESYYHLAKKFLNSKQEFYQRFGFVLFLNHFIEDDYIDEILEICETTKTDGYYSMMAAAWLLSMIYLKYPTKTIEFFETSKQDRVLINKAIQKIRESYRVSLEDKEMLKQYKR